MSNTVSLKEQNRIKSCVELALKIAAEQGATDADVAGSVEAGFTVNSRMCEVENIEFHRDKQIDIAVYFDKRKGSASTTDISETAVKNTVEAACRMAKYAESDPCHGLPDKAFLAYDYPDCDLYHPWGLTVEEAIEKTIAGENAGLEYDKRITNSDGAFISTHNRYFAMANSKDFLGEFQSSMHDHYCILIAEESGAMERDYDYSVGRNPNDLEATEAAAKKAAALSLSRLNARKLKTQKTPVIFDSRISSGLFKILRSAISGSSLYRKSSFLLDMLGKQVLPSFVSLHEKPHIQGGIASSPFDSEGVKTTDKRIVKDGILESYLLSSYSARKLKMQPTGHVGGVRNVFVETGTDISRDDLLKQMGTGFLVTETIGHGVNLTTGDYSQGASGFWVENGEIQYAVHEVTIAGNLKDMLLNIIAMSNDIDSRKSILAGSILIEEMMVAGE